jgi:hypothetical protein
MQGHHQSVVIRGPSEEGTRRGTSPSMSEVPCMSQGRMPHLLPAKFYSPRGGGSPLHD